MKRRETTGALRKWVEAKAAVRDAGGLKLLPTTRSLGDQFGVSHGTAFRLLCRLAQEGKVWRHPNGRFYPRLAGRVLNRPKPLAVLLRRMDGWSALCREVMEGFTEKCAEHEREMLLVFHRRLLGPKSSMTSVHLALPRVQKEMLEDFTLLHGQEIGGVLLDELWSDSVLAAAWPSGVPGVVFHRPTSVPGIGSVAPDFKAGALLAFSHLLACGYQRICLLPSLRNYAATKCFLEAAREMYRKISGVPLPRQNEIALYEPGQWKELVNRLSESGERWGLICPEDHAAMSLAEELRARGVQLGKRHGLIALMGTSIVRFGELTSVRYDFQEMGRQAARMLCDGVCEQIVIKPELVTSASTASG
jgi:DNA-binding LacI/PurR family transcriptional regulator